MVVRDTHGVVFVLMPSRLPVNSTCSPGGDWWVVVVVVVVIVVVGGGVTMTCRG